MHAKHCSHSTGSSEDSSELMEHGRDRQSLCDKWLRCRRKKKDDGNENKNTP